MKTKSNIKAGNFYYLENPPIILPNPLGQFVLPNPLG